MASRANGVVMKGLKNILPLALLGILFSCGNPHFVAQDLGLETHIAPMVPLTSLSGISLSIPGSLEKRLVVGIDTKTATTSSQNIVVTNLDKVLYEVSYSLESGEHFRFTGGSFPGTQGDCSSLLLALGQCQIDIEFYSTKTGKFSDTLKVVYSLKDETQNAITLTFPLEGEATKSKDLDKTELKFAEIINSSLDMGDVQVGKKSIKMLELKNSGNLDAELSPKLDSSEFSFTGGSFPGTNGTCSLTMSPGTCLIELAFSPKEKGQRNARLTLRYNEQEANVQLSGTGSQKICTSEETLIIHPRTKGVASQVSFPFKNFSSKTQAKLSTLYGTEANYRIDKYYTVKDAQVFVSYDLPVIDGRITDMKLDLHVMKVLFDSYRDTEMLCLSTPSLKRCSGHKFALEAWNMLLNKDFWKDEKGPINEMYEELLVGTEKKCGTRSCMTFNTPVHFTDVFSLDRVSLESLSAERRLNIIISDDTRLLTMPTLEVTVKKETACGE